MSDLYNIIEPKGKRVPVLINSPHSGIAFPEDLKGDYRPELIGKPMDADLYMPELYDFASELGITMITANYCRWVIDLNRDPESAPLYNDGRLITGLCTTTTFEGDPIYKEGKEPNQEEVKRRLDTYYWPYYAKVQEYLDDLIKEFGQVLIYDLHSIKRTVKAISKEDFPDIVLGTADETSADPKLIDIAVKNFKNSEYTFSHNHPFKGGHITRYFGKPDKNQHALQVERSKDIYLDDSEMNFHEERSDKFRKILKNNLIELIEATKNL
jgi:N-formylglutamate deformylase